MRIDVIVVAEARADHEIGIGIVKRVSGERGDSHEFLSRGIEQATPFTVWNKVKGLAARNDRPIKRTNLDRGGFKGGDADTAMQIAALCSLRPGNDRPFTILLVRDTDNDTNRAEGLSNMVARLRDRGVRILLAHPNPKREAWVLHGFDPRNAHEEKLLKDQRKLLGFDPRTDSHRLIAKGRKGNANAKTVLDALTQKDREREDACWQETKLSILKSRGKHTGLAAFIEELDQWFSINEQSSN